MPSPALTGAVRTTSRVQPSLPSCSRWQAQRHIHSSEWNTLYLACPSDSQTPEHCDYILKVANESLVQAADTQFACQRIARECQVAHEVFHAQVVPVFDYCIDNTSAWLVQPYLGATILADLIVENTPLPHKLWMLRQSAQGLAALHAKHWLHGDICPQNIAISSQTHATLLDFGFARRLQTAECELSVTPFLGRVLYAAPELFGAGIVTAAADMYSFGAMLCEMLLGYPPWAEYGAEAIIAAKKLLPPPDLRNLTTDCPYLLAEFVKRLLAREPLRRPTAQETIEFLVRLEIEHFASWKQAA
jgi:eukaryotic-like serine/threonine-protein kinase